jgi:mono/diheme cytochrome c family protein
MMKPLMIAATILAGSWHALPTLAADTPQDSRLGAKQYGNAERGQEIVTMWCMSCHKMGATTDDRIPSLQALAGNPKRTDGAIRAFLMQPHKPMPPLEIGTQQIEDIVAYLRTLAATPAPPAKP